MPLLRSARLVALVLVALLPRLGSAQIISGSARAAGMADAYGVIARGPMAVFYNPANLGLPGNPGFGVILPTATVTYGTSPVTLSQIKKYGGAVVPDSVKQQWLNSVPAGGTFRGTVQADVGDVGFSFWRLAFAAGTVGDVTANVPRGAAELLLFGNAGATGTPTNQVITNGSATGFAASFAAASLGIPLVHVGEGRHRHTLAIGVTGKYVVGHALGTMWDAGGTLTANPVTADLRFPAATVYNTSSPFNSHGVGLDAGIALQGPVLSLGATVTDITNSFAWNQADARVRDGQAYLSADSSGSRFDERLLTDPTVPAALAAAARDRITQATFKPAVRLAAALTPSRRLTITADYLHRSATGFNLQAGPANTVSAGVEFRPLMFLPLRAGGSIMDGGQLWTVGSGLEFGVVNVNVAYGRRTGTIGAASRLAVGVGFGAGR